MSLIILESSLSSHKWEAGDRERTLILVKTVIILLIKTNELVFNSASETTGLTNLKNIVKT